jgi:hypothetical protein
MTSVDIACLCGSVRLRIEGEPETAFYCHCDDCQAVHGAAYAGIALYPTPAVTVTRGEPVTWTYRTLPRERCPECGTWLLVRLPDIGLTGVKGNLLPKGAFRPAFHIHCQHAVLPVRDDLPHYRGFPAAFGGSDEQVDW